MANLQLLRVWAQALRRHATFWPVFGQPVSNEV